MTTIALEATVKDSAGQMRSFALRYETDQTAGEALVALEAALEAAGWRNNDF